MFHLIFSAVVIMNVTGQIQGPFMMGQTLVGNVECRLRPCSMSLPKTEISFGNYSDFFPVVLMLSLH